MDGGVRVFELTAQAGTSEPVAGRATPTWGFNGAVLGPTLRAQNGERVRVVVRNHLDEETSVHWHGMHVPARADGGPHQPIAPGASWTAEWTVDQEPATLWYHPHPHGATERHVYRGLAGFFLLDAADGARAPSLPHEYGVDDIPVVIQDRRYTPAGQLDETTSDDVGMTGPVILTNGISDAHLVCTRQRTRLRLLNGSSGRSYHLGFSDDREFRLIGTDGGLLPKPVVTERIFLSPGERAEIVVDLRPDEQVLLRSYPADAAHRGRIDSRLARRFGLKDTVDVLTLRTGRVLGTSAEVPARLAEIAPIAPASSVPRRNFDLQWHMINHERMAMSHRLRRHRGHHRGMGRPQRGQLAAQLPRARRPVPGAHHQRPDATTRVAGRKDTLYLAPGDRATIAMTFSGPSDPMHPYMFHCHLLAHEDGGMMGQFLVLP